MYRNDPKEIRLDNKNLFEHHREYLEDPWLYEYLIPGRVAMIEIATDRSYQTILQQLSTTALAKDAKKPKKAENPETETPELFSVEISAEARHTHNNFDYVPISKLIRIARDTFNSDQDKVDALISQQKKKTKELKYNSVAKFFMALLPPFNRDLDIRDFKHSNKDALRVLQYQSTRKKQAIAEAMYVKLNTLMSPEYRSTKSSFAPQLLKVVGGETTPVEPFPFADFEYCISFIKKHGQFRVANIPVDKAETLFQFIQAERIRNKKEKPWFEAATKEAKEYSEYLKIIESELLTNRNPIKEIFDSTLSLGELFIKDYFIKYLLDYYPDSPPALKDPALTYRTFMDTFFIFKNEQDKKQILNFIENLLIKIDADMPWAITASLSATKAEIKKNFEYLKRLLISAKEKIKSGSITVENTHYKMIDDSQYSQQFIRRYNALQQNPAMKINYATQINDQQLQDLDTNLSTCLDNELNSIEKKIYELLPDHRLCKNKLITLLQYINCGISYWEKSNASHSNALKLLKRIANGEEVKPSVQDKHLIESFFASCYEKSAYSEIVDKHLQQYPLADNIIARIIAIRDAPESDIVLTKNKIELVSDSDESLDFFHQEEQSANQVIHKQLEPTQPAATIELSVETSSDDDSSQSTDVSKPKMFG